MRRSAGRRSRRSSIAEELPLVFVRTFVFTAPLRQSTYTARFLIVPPIHRRPIFSHSADLKPDRVTPFGRRLVLSGAERSFFVRRLNRAGSCTRGLPPIPQSSRTNPTVMPCGRHVGR